MNLPDNCESRISSAQFQGQTLVPNPELIVQKGPTCVFYAIVACAIMQLRLMMFRMGVRCNVLFDVLYFIRQYVRRYGPLGRDPGPREKHALMMFRDEGVLAYDISGRPPYVSRVMKIKEFTSYPPLPDPSRPGALLVLTFEFVAYLIQQGRPVLGSFPVRLDVDKEGLTEFDKLGDKIYDFWSPTLPYNPNLPSATHLVTFVDYGKTRGRPFLKFVNTHDRSWGEDGFGKVFFDCVYQRDDTFCFHTLSFDDLASSSSSSPAPAAVWNQFTLPPPPTAQPPLCRWHGIQILDPIYEAAQVSDIDHMERLTSCMYMALPIFTRGTSSSKFLNYFAKQIVPVFDKIPEERKLDLLKTVAASSPYTVAQDSRQLLPSVVQFLKKYMPGKKVDDINHNYDECLLYAFHHLAHKTPNTTNSLYGYKIVTGQPSDRLGEDFSEHYKDFIERLTGTEETVRAASKRLTQGMEDFNKAISSAKREEEKIRIKADQQESTMMMRSYNNILAISQMSGDRVPVGGECVAEDVVSAKEGKGAIGKAKSFNEKHGGFTSTTDAEVPAIENILGNEKMARKLQPAGVRQDQVRIGCCQEDGEQRRI